MEIITDNDYTMAVMAYESLTRHLFNCSRCHRIKIMGNEFEVCKTYELIRYETIYYQKKLKGKTKTDQLNFGF